MVLLLHHLLVTLAMVGNLPGKASRQIHGDDSCEVGSGQFAVPLIQIRGCPCISSRWVQLQFVRRRGRSDAQGEISWSIIALQTDAATATGAAPCCR